MYWYKQVENGNLQIRRYYKGKQERYPRKLYKGLSEKEIDRLILRINLPLKKEAEFEKVEFNSAFYSKDELFDICLKFAVKSRYREYRAKHLASLLAKYFFPFFLANNCRDKDDFKKAEMSWIDHLVEKHELSVVSIKHIIEVSNNFLQFHAEKNGIERHQFSKKNIPIQRIKAKRFNRVNKRRFVEEDEFQKLLKVAHRGIVPHLKLAYYYGLRLGETICFQADQIFEDHIRITKAVNHMGKEDIPKDAEIREIPHVYMKNHECYELAKHKVSVERTSLSKLTADAVGILLQAGEISTPFDFHSLRGSYCTRLCSQASKFDLEINDIRELMGHSDLKTTMRYVYKRKKFSGKRYRPDEEAA